MKFNFRKPKPSEIIAPTLFVLGHILMIFVMIGFVIITLLASVGLTYLYETKPDIFTNEQWDWLFLLLNTAPFMIFGLWLYIWFGGLIREYYAKLLARLDRK